ncbi:MAG: ABC transporter ATP-binding protein [Planctomycetales bacterium]
MISVDNLSVRLGSFSLKGISFEIPQGEYGVLMGKTGSGKTTILEAVCGLKPILGGTIVLHDRDVTRAKASQREVGYVPQEGALFTTMTVWRNLAFALVVRKRPTSEIAARVDELAEMLGIQHLLNRLPRGLSGGERQRVALGRALAFGPGVLCLDEPLSAVDEETKSQMYDLLKLVQRRTGVTVLHVTHSRTESKTLGDRLLVLENGVIRQASLNDKSSDDKSSDDKSSGDKSSGDSPLNVLGSNFPDSGFSGSIASQDEDGS